MNTESLVYRSGDVFLPKSTVRFLDQYIYGNKESLFYINYWHINHFFSGVLFGFFSLFVYRVQHPFVVYIVLHTLWELWQIAIGMTFINLRGFIDILNDTLVGTLGVFLSLHLLERKQ